MAIAGTLEPKTELSRKAEALFSRKGPALKRQQVILALGSPDWVLLPSDKHDWSPEGDRVALLWDNGDDCTHVEVWVDPKGEVTSSVSGKFCDAEQRPGRLELADLRASKGRFKCNAKGRARYCS